MAKGDPPVSPYTYQAVDLNGKKITGTFPYDNTTKALQNATVFRDPGCLFTTVYIGVGPDGTPNTSAVQFKVPSGTTTVTVAQMASIGLHVFGDIENLQITAG